jgi:hypothetical protein
MPLSCQSDLENLGASMSFILFLHTWHVFDFTVDLSPSEIQPSSCFLGIWNLSNVRTVWFDLALLLVTYQTRQIY